MSRIEHIEVEKALELLGQSKKLYGKLINGFVEKYTNIYDDFHQLIEKKEYEEARRLAHSIKGLCGNLGAASLSELAKKLEFSFRDGTDDYIELLPVFTKELEVVLQEIVIIKETIVGVDQTAIVQTESSEAVYRLELDRLYKALKNFKYSEVKLAYEKIKTYTVPAFYSDIVPSVFGAIEHFDYKNAAGILESRLGY